MNRKFIAYQTKKGDLTGSVSTTTVTVTGVVECLQVCQEGSVRSNCKAVNYYKTTKACELISQYALDVSEYPGYIYFELVTGACPVQHITKCQSLSNNTIRYAEIGHVVLRFTT